MSSRLLSPRAGVGSVLVVALVGVAGCGGVKRVPAYGTVTLDGQPLRQSDGAAASEQSSLRLIGIESAELLVFDLR